MKESRRQRKLIDRGLDGPFQPRTIDQTWKPGYVGFCHSIGIVGASIRLDQRLSGNADWEVNHCFILDEPVVPPRDPEATRPPGVVTGFVPQVVDWWVIQAEGHGVSRSLLSTVAPGGYYEIIAPPVDVDLDLVRQFCNANLGCKYGFFTIASLVADQLTPKFVRIASRKVGTWICSALSAEALRFGGWYFPWPDIYQCLPAQVRAVLTTVGTVC